MTLTHGWGKLQPDLVIKANNSLALDRMITVIIRHS